MREISTLISENRSQLGADGGNLYSELSLMHKRRCGTVASIKDILSLVKHPRNFFNEHLYVAWDLFIRHAIVASVPLTQACTFR